MRLRVWSYYFKHAWSNILANRLIHLISIGTIGISLLLFASFLVLFLNINSWIMDWGQSVSMSVYLKDGIDEKTKEKIESLLKNLPGVELKGFTSKEKAFRDLAQGLGAHSGLLDGLKSNPLPASFELLLRDVNIHEINPRKMKDEIEKIKGVDEVQYSREVLERLEGLMYVLKVAGFIIGGFLCLAVLFITTNTIKLTIYSRREEIEIFKLVGATDWFVKIPFLIEGAIQGLLGGLVSLIVLFGLYAVFFSKKVHIIGLPVLNVAFLPPAHVVSMLLLGLVLGLVGSFIAIGRFFEI
jgi:cell division transport system permease protein